MRSAQPVSSRLKHYALALPLAVLVQLGAVALFVAVSSWAHPTVEPKKKPQPVTFRTLDAAQWASNRGRTAPLERDRNPKPVTPPRGQIVDVAPGNNRVPNESKYVAETNNTVAKETRARNQTNVWGAATPTTTARPDAAPVAKGNNAGERTSATPPKPSRESFLGALTPRFNLLDSPAGNGTPTTEAHRPGADDGQALASRSADATESGGGAPNDDLNDVALGNATALNTREWKYASFFNRVKQAVSAKWNPNARLSQHPQRDFGYADRHTLLHVTLRPDGSLADAYVAQTSGLDWLDLEAVHAFERAQPFPNPPAALVEQGAIRFQFSFTVTHDMAASFLPLR